MVNVAAEGQIKTDLKAILHPQKTDIISSLMDKYETYKSNYAANIKFDSRIENFSKCSN